MAVTCWFIWKERCKFVFSRTQFDPAAVIAWAEDFVAELNSLKMSLGIVELTC